MMPSKQLFWGDNGVHEFWESEDHELLIFRNHGECDWSAHRNHGFLFGCRDAMEAATRLKVFLSPTHTWVKKDGRFRLQPSCSVHQGAGDSKAPDTATESAV
jgi:hypothetical protein